MILDEEGGVESLDQLIGYDVYQNGLPNWTVKVPSVVMYPGGHSRKEEYFTFKDDYYHKALTLIDFVALHATNKFDASKLHSKGFYSNNKLKSEL